MDYPDICPDRSLTDADEYEKHIGEYVTPPTEFTVKYAYKPELDTVKLDEALAKIDRMYGVKR